MRDTMASQLVPDRPHYRCDCPGCDRPASAVCFLPDISDFDQVLLVCRHHDPGGYRADIDDVLRGVLRWYTDPPEATLRPNLVIVARATSATQPDGAA